MSPRRQLIDDCLKNHALDALLLWRPEEIVMLAGRLPHWGLTVGLVRRGRPTLLFVPAVEPRFDAPAEVEVKSFPWGQMGVDGWLVLEKELLSALGGLRAGARRSHGHAAPAGNAAEAPPFREDLALRMAPLDATGAVNELLARKTAEDVSRIRCANRIALRGLQAGFARIAEGVSEVEVAATIEAEIHRWTGRDGIELARGWAAVQAGANAVVAGRFSRSSARPLRAGDTVVIELATCVDGYWSDLTRTTAIGDGGAAYAEAYATLAAARDAALRALRSGVLACDVDAASRRLIDSAGWGDEFPHPTGHPTGFRYHDAGPVLAPDCVDLLHAGMVLTIEPGIYSAEHRFGCRIEENVLVTEDGYELLSAEEDVGEADAHTSVGRDLQSGDAR